MNPGSDFTIACSRLLLTGALLLGLCGCQFDSAASPHTGSGDRSTTAPAGAKGKPSSSEDGSDAGDSRSETGQPAPEFDAGEDSPAGEPTREDGGAGVRDAGMPDADMQDAGTRDAGMRDAGPEDAGTKDAGSVDAGPPVRDAGRPSDPCSRCLESRCTRQWLSCESDTCAELARCFAECGNDVPCAGDCVTRYERGISAYADLRACEGDFCPFECGRR